MAQETGWLRSLLGISELRKPCSVHQKPKILFCIDCKCDICQICSKNNPHKKHRRIKIYRNSNYDVFHHEDIQNLYDCSEIQTYKGNDKQTVRLRSRPDAGKESQSSAAVDSHATCAGCGENRIYTDGPITDNRFCSIECKLLVLDNVAPEDHQNDAEESPSQESVGEEAHSS